MPAMTVPIWAASPSRASPRISGDRPSARALAAIASSAIIGRGDHAEVDVRQAAGFRGFIVVLVQAGGDGWRQGDAVAGDQGSDLGESRGVGDGGAGADHGGIVPWNVADRQGHDPGRCGGGGEAAAFDRRQMLPDGVHLGDVGAAGQQRAVDRLLVGQRQAGDRGGEQGGGAARHQRDDEVVLGQALDALQQSFRAAFAVFVGHRVGGFDDLDLAGRDGVAVAGDDGALQRRHRARRPPTRRP